MLTAWCSSYQEKIGGIPSTFSGKGCGYLFGEHDTPHVVARWVHKQMMPYERYVRCAVSWLLLTDFSWDAAVHKLREFSTRELLLLLLAGAMGIRYLLLCLNLACWLLT